MRFSPPPLANSRTNGRSETGEAALERAPRDGSKGLLKLKIRGHVSGQGQVKGQNGACSHLGLWGPASSAISGPISD